MVRLPRNEKQTYRLNSRVQMWPSGLTLAMTLTLNFQGQIQNLLYLSQKWSDCHETKSKHIDWTLGLKCDHRVWLWPWRWPWIFKVKYRICYISAKNGPIASKRKANISIELQASNLTNGFELDHNLDLWILKVKCDLDLWPHRWPWPWIFMVKFWNSCISEWEGWLTLHKGGGSRSFMTMIMTIWWPRSGVWIYQVVTGVTSVVGVPSTHLVEDIFSFAADIISGAYLMPSRPSVHPFVNFFIRSSLDGTYYGMALSVRPSVRPSVRSSVRPTVSTKKHRCKWRIFFKFCTLVCLGVPSINLLFVLSYLIKYAHNSIISDFSIFGFHRVIF